MSKNTEGPTAGKRSRKTSAKRKPSVHEPIKNQRLVTQFLKETTPNDYCSDSEVTIKVNNSELKKRSKSGNIYSITLVISTEESCTNQSIAYSQQTKTTQARYTNMTSGAEH